METERYPYNKYVWSMPELDWEISGCAAGEQEFVKLTGNSLRNLARELPDFAGVLRYETEFALKDSEDVEVIDLGDVGETAQLWLNDAYCGSCVSKPYQFDVREYCQTGKNTMRIEVMNNLGYKERDMFSEYLPLPPTGLLGDVRFGKNSF